jgi:death on curing protein
VIPTKEILTIHKTLIDNFQTYDNTDLYKTFLDKAAALIESLLINHPFVDGNKRTGYTVLRLFLMQNGLDFTASQTSR